MIFYFRGALTLRSVTGVRGIEVIGRCLFMGGRHAMNAPDPLFRNRSVAAVGIYLCRESVASFFSGQIVKGIECV